MPTIKTPGPRSTDGPITYADVLACVPVDDAGVPQANSTNSGAIRTQLGRGSNATVQKHLDAIRAELGAAAAPKPVGAVPEAPADAVGAIWAAAWSAAQATVLSRLDTVTVERDQARARVDVLTADRDAATAEADQQRDQAAAAVADRDRAKAREAELLTRIDADQQARVDIDLAMVRDGEAVDARHKRELDKHQHAAELLAREREIERQALQGQIDRLQERVAELRAVEIWAAGKAAKEGV
jgi:hypothetical protein